MTSYVEILGLGAQILNFNSQILSFDLQSVLLWTDRTWSYIMVTKTLFELNRVTWNLKSQIAYAINTCKTRKSKLLRRNLYT